MLIVLVNNLPPVVRGRMKLWFIEAKPNVFVSGLKDTVASKVVDYLFQYCPIESSPRTWGCFFMFFFIGFREFVFPTHVGVFPWRDPLRA